MIYPVDGINKSSRKRPAGAPLYKHTDGEFWFEGRVASVEGVVAKPRRLYKVLSSTGRSPLASAFEWPLPTISDDGTITPGDWVTIEGPILPCQRGLHAFDGDQWKQWVDAGRRLFEIEFDGPVARVDHEKYVGARARLVRELPSELLTTSMSTLDPYVNNADTMAEKAAIDVRKEFTKEFAEHALADFFEKVDLTPLGDMADEARAALAKSSIAWSIFLEGLGQRRDAASRVIDSYRRLKNALPNAPSAPTDLVAMHDELVAAYEAARKIIRPQSSSSMPWDTSAVSYADAEKVGLDWYADWLKRERAAEEEARVKARADFESGDRPDTFDALVDKAIA